MYKDLTSSEEESSEELGSFFFGADLDILAGLTGFFNSWNEKIIKSI